MKKRNNTKKKYNINQTSFYFEDYFESNKKNKYLQKTNFFKDRMYILFFLFFSLILIFSIRIIHISLNEIEIFNQDTQKFSLLRRDIVDRNGTLISRNITTQLSKRITGRTRLSPAAMEATHDLDYALWCLAPRKPVRVYSQQVEKVLIKNSNSADCQFIMVTLDDGTVVTVGAGWVLPPSYPNYSSTKMEFIGSKGAIILDDTHNDVTIMTGERGIEYPMSSMPGEPVGHVNAGPMAEETNNFIDAILFNKPVIVKPREARVVMELYQAADLSAERGEPINLPINIDPLEAGQA